MLSADLKKLAKALRTIGQANLGNYCELCARQAERLEDQCQRAPSAERGLVEQQRVGGCRSGGSANYL